jgi:hypothetical protein
VLKLETLECWYSRGVISKCDSRAEASCPLSEDPVRAKCLVWIFPISFLCIFFFFPAPSMAQMRPGTPSTTDNGNPPDENRDRMEHDRAKKANEDRQAALKSDTEKLVKLAGELKEYVDKSNENVLSLDVVKKADEIEKLAKSVKEKMRGQN